MTGFQFWMIVLAVVVVGGISWDAWRNRPRDPMTRWNRQRDILSPEERSRRDHPAGRNR